MMGNYHVRFGGRLTEKESERMDSIYVKELWVHAPDHLAGCRPNYDCLPDGCVVCRLRLRLGDEWITKVDVGGPSEQPDSGDRMKAAFSEALKRAAVKFGLGRYLYRLPSQWVDYDPHKKCFLKAPSLPVSALPVREERDAKDHRDPREGRRSGPSRPLRPLSGLPKSGPELQKRLADYDARLASQGVCQAGELVKHIVGAGVKAGYAADLATWTGPAISLAVEETKAFEARARQRLKEQKVA
jgi:hypothetical protein